MSRSCDWPDNMRVSYDWLDYMRGSCDWPDDQGEPRFRRCQACTVSLAGRVAKAVRAQVSRQSCVVPRY